MKILAKSLLTALLLSTATLVSTAATSVENPAVPTSYKVAVFPSPSASKLNVYVEREPGQFMLISLKALDGTLLGKQLVGKKEGSFHFQFDLSDLQDGKYTVEVSSGNDVTVHSITLSTQSATAATRTLTLK